MFGISGDERFVIGLADPTVLALYELDTGRCVMRFEGHTDDVYTAALSPDGRFCFRVDTIIPYVRGMWRTGLAST